MVRSKQDDDNQAPLDAQTWARAVLLGTAVLGVTLGDRALNAKNVDRLGRRSRDIVHTLTPVVEAMIHELQSLLTITGARGDCDRLRTARSALALLQSIATQKNEDIVDILANARLETSSSAVQATLSTATELLATLRDPDVVQTLERLAELERVDLSASKYLREARAILQQDETKRSLPFDLRMVIGSSDAYLSTGKQSMLNVSAFEPSQDYDFSTPTPPSAVANVVAPTNVVIESKTKTRPPPAPPSNSRSKKSAMAKTLASEDATSVTKVIVERRGAGLDRASARAIVEDAMREAVHKIEQSKVPILVTINLTLDVTRDE